MTVRKETELAIRTQDDVVMARQLTRRWAIEVGLSLVDQTKIVTAASEIARNTFIHGGGGGMNIEIVENQGKQGVRLTFRDSGPGIADVQQALRDGFTTGNGLGLGLGGARRLSSEFEIESEIGKGTRVTITRWKA